MICPKCTVELPVHFFYPDKSSKSGKASWCKKCISSRGRRYRVLNAEKVKQRGRDYYKKHAESIKAKLTAKRVTPYKDAAHNAVKKALKAGMFRKPKCCNDCGAACDTNAHHFLGYGEEHRLSIEWLCKSCHGFRHTQDDKCP